MNRSMPNAVCGILVPGLFVSGCLRVVDLEGPQEILAEEGT